MKTDKTDVVQDPCGRGDAKDLGLLIIRIGLGIMFLYHGYPKLAGGPEKWAGIGSAMQHFGVSFGYPFWGFMAGMSEFFGGLLLIFGLFTRVAAFFMLCVMVTAATMHLAQGDGLLRASHAIEDGIVFFGFIFMGAGAYSLRCKIRALRNKWYG